MQLRYALRMDPTPGQARLKVARQHTKAADARREFHYQTSTKIICEDQTVVVDSSSSMTAKSKTIRCGT
ncbi:hypothetical protein ACFXJ8_16515 [Nonomuraea sp. NPDC059194]|uniref:hypothetical protein n=1 Tax=Nonomuraea sp. NPDC059194 TaxID=3346764 RepID=UPI0036C206FB